MRDDRGSFFRAPVPVERRRQQLEPRRQNVRPRRKPRRGILYLLLPRRSHFRGRISERI